MRPERAGRLIRGAVFLCAVLLLPATAHAQNGTWEVEVHGGRSLVSPAPAGTGALPAPGASFTTFTGAPSRRVSSWYFGDGAELANSVLSVAGFPERIAPLDSVLTHALGRQNDGTGFGFRVGRRITSRVGAEVSLDTVSAPFDLTSEALTGVNASRDSYRAAFADGLLLLGPFLDATVTTDLQTRTRTNRPRQLVATATLNVNLVTGGRFIPYATVGGGVLVNRGDTPAMDVNGEYSLALAGVDVIAESDHVTLKSAIDGHVPVGVLGGGIRAFLTGQSGLRVDVRVHVGRQTVRTLVSARPGTVASSGPASDIVVASFTSPGIQFSNNDAMFGPSSLSGPVLTDVESFRARDSVRQVLVTAGYFWQF